MEQLAEDFVSQDFFSCMVRVSLNFAIAPYTLWTLIED